ncbi:F-box/LRR-repeat protein At3g48880-like [Phoenix dactylifera]|uniref:F-box/LRR-repeat protein At3g48880-like n=1 Tax=Phoenix dactylifera TaxID=42345 RepID=A0A8B7CEA5_PHODC|nr:F-box/LRR-repeat protein At3g48880-like [Phoenix dactylifera]XP_008797417.1 F-box/LRR-repeat protein At3g48880-like [Phoenix dactylifera]XP_026662546.1 F-box/LRR-repeat protein At3g48880-like [Phoenix dactylifera]XP_026662547.1 F-box/LRR-repeat protein At3g48880-like [Phoenix dactylifera]
MAAAYGGAAGESSTASAAGIGGRWEDLNRDLLVAIFERMGVADLIAGVPFVCSSWRVASLDPLCWRNLDFRDWESICLRLFFRRNEILDFADLLDFSITRAHEHLDSIYFPDFADDIDLLDVSERCPELTYFSLPNPHVMEHRFCEAVSKLEFLKGMAVDESVINREVLQHVNKCCKYFTELNVFAENVDEEKASIICKSLPDLRKLEITNSAISRQAIITFLDELKDLEHLDISGYENSGITDLVLEKASRLKVFLWDSRFELGEFMACSNNEEDDWLLQRSCECMLDSKVMEWLAELS